jgi:hypothetical protein
VIGCKRFIDKMTSAARPATLVEANPSWQEISRSKSRVEMVAVRFV